MVATSGELEIVDLPERAPAAPIVIPPLPPAKLVLATTLVDPGRANALSSYPPTSLPLPPPATTRKRAPPRLVVAAVVLLLLGGAAGGARRLSRSNRATMPPPAPLVEASPAPAPSESRAEPPAVEALPSAESAAPPAASLDRLPPGSAPSTSAARPRAAPPTRGPAHPRRTSPKTK
jgi:hypothetical protein